MSESISDLDDLKPVWKRITWSLSWAAKGLWPTHDQDGNLYSPRSVEGMRAKQPLAGNYCLALYTFKQDLDHLALQYKMSDYRTTHRLCEICPCNKVVGDWPNNYNNFNLDAAWMQKGFTASQWAALNPDPHPLFKEEHISCHNVEPDEAHILHLGTSQYLAGSILWMMVYSCDKNSRRICRREDGQYLGHASIGI